MVEYAPGPVKDYLSDVCPLLRYHPVSGTRSAERKAYPPNALKGAPLGF